MEIIGVNEVLLNALVKATRDGLSMAGIDPVPIGVSRYVTTTREVSAIIGLVGSTSGAVMVNASKEITCQIAEKMLKEKCEQLTPQALDSISEIGNIIAGQTKAILSTTEWKIEKISCPSVVVGSSYFISHYKGMLSVAVDFELGALPLISLNERLFTVSISLMTT
ncbi:MAG: chemotaxis protein CheX [Planctomycetes bacterium]|nr:chemotaxis protein CheX [Planctomycetota bacterium]